MDNFFVNSLTNLANSQNQKADNDLLEEKIKELYENGEIKYLNVFEISEIAQECNVTSAEVMECIESMRDDYMSGANKTKQNETDNYGMSGYYYGQSSIAASDDSMNNLNNYGNYMKIMYGIN